MGLVPDPSRTTAALVLELQEAAAQGGQWAWPAGCSGTPGLSVVAVRWVGPSPAAAEPDEKDLAGKGPLPCSAQGSVTVQLGVPGGSSPEMDPLLLLPYPMLFQVLLIIPVPQLAKEQEPQSFKL